MSVTPASAPTPFAAPFYITGGTLPPEASSYVTRRADADLYDNLRAGEYCYVLNSRQMGKSSLCVRTIGRLRDAGVQTAFVDLTRFGGKNLSVEQWYAGLLSEIGRELGLRGEFLAYWKAHGELSPLQRLFGALQEVALTKTDAPIVVFVDEIDVTRSLPFSADEFFAAIRQCYVGRATDPFLKRLAFCLLGTATPAELIQDTRVSPFNIGRRIALEDFTREEAAPLARGMAGGQAILDRALYWTNGHPYLTQRLCRAIAEQPATITASDVDRLCGELFLTHKAKEADDNLAFVRNRLLKSEADPAALLDLYRRMRANKPVPDDETNSLCAVLKLSGVARVADGALKVRNRIYAHVFDRQWATTHMPDAEQRRQRRAFRRGIALAGGIGGAMLLIVATLGLLTALGYRQAARNYRKAQEQTALAQRQTALAGQRAEEADYNLYVANMNLIQRDWDNGNVTHAQELLEATRQRGQGTFEWGYWNRLLHLELLTLKGHTGAVYGVALSPDGTRIATGGDDGTVRVWDAATGDCLYIFRWLPASKTPSYIGKLVFSPNGSHLLTCGNDGAKLLDAATGKEQKTFQVHSYLFSAVFSPDGRRIVTTSNGAAIVRDAVTGKELLTIKPEGISKKSEFSPTFAAFSPDGKRIVTASQDQTARVWNAATGKALLIIKGNIDHGIFPVAFSPDGKRIVTGMYDHTAQIWDAQTGKAQTKLTGHADAIHDIIFSADGKRIATGGDEGMAKVWDVPTGNCLITFKGHTGSVNSIAFSPNSKRLITCGDNTAKVWDTTTEQAHLTHITHTSNIYTLFDAAFLPDGKRIVTNENEVLSTIWDAVTGKTLITHKVPIAGSFVADFSPDGNCMAVESYVNGAYMLMWDSATGIKQKVIQGGLKLVSAVFSQDGKRIAVFGANTTEVLDAATGEEVLILHRQQNNLVKGSFSLDGRYIATINDDNTASVWNAVSGKEEQTFQAHAGGFTAVTISPDSRRVATGSADRTANIWDTASGRCLLTFKGHASYIASVAFSNNGKRLLTSSRDRTAKVWDADTGADLLTLKGHIGALDSAAFSPDGRRIVTGSVDGTAKVWYADDTRLSEP